MTPVSSSVAEIVVNSQCLRRSKLTERAPGPGLLRTKLLVMQLRNQVTEGSFTERAPGPGVLSAKLLVTQLRNQVTEGSFTEAPAP